MYRAWTKYSVLLCLKCGVMNFSIQLSIDKFIYAFIFMKDLRFDLRSNPENTNTNGNLVKSIKEKIRQLSIKFAHQCWTQNTRERMKTQRRRIPTAAYSVVPPSTSRWTIQHTSESIHRDASIHTRWFIELGILVVLDIQILGHFR